MASCALKDLNVRCGGEEPPDAQRSLKSFNAQLAVDYPAYAMVICYKYILLFFMFLKKATYG